MLSTGCWQHLLVLVWPTWPYQPKHSPSWPHSIQTSSIKIICVWRTEQHSHIYIKQSNQLDKDWHVLNDIIIIMSHCAVKCVSGHALYVSHCTAAWRRYRVKMAACCWLLLLETCQNYWLCHVTGSVTALCAFRCHWYCHVHVCQCVKNVSCVEMFKTRNLKMYLS